MFATSSRPSHAIACVSETIGIAGRLGAEAAMRSTYMASARSALMTSESCCALASSRSSTMRTATSGSLGTAKVPCSRLCARSDRTSLERSSSLAG